MNCLLFLYFAESISQGFHLHVGLASLPSLFGLNDLLFFSSIKISELSNGNGSNEGFVSTSLYHDLPQLSHCKMPHEF
jgi:hypothetical protein